MLDDQKMPDLNVAMDDVTDEMTSQERVHYLVDAIKDCELRNLVDDTVTDHRMGCATVETPDGWKALDS